jgi:hypothetical protein
MFLILFVVVDPISPGFDEIAEATPKAENNNATTIDATDNAEEGWTHSCEDGHDVFGSNVPGKLFGTRAISRQKNNYRKNLKDYISIRYKGFLLFSANDSSQLFHDFSCLCQHPK